MKKTVSQEINHDIPITADLIDEVCPISREIREYHWEGCLREYWDKTSVELQHEVLNWWGGDHK